MSLFPTTPYTLHPTPLRSRGFTLVELMVSVGIFIFMTALLVARYGTFNQSVLLTDTAYDLALIMRSAQVYGTSVRAGEGSTNFNVGYGIEIRTSDKDIVDGVPANRRIVFYSSPVDSVSGSGPTYVVGATPGSQLINAYVLRNGMKVTGICSGYNINNCLNQTNNLMDLAFQRPDPSAIMCLAKEDSDTGQIFGMSCNGTFAYTQITLSASDGSKRRIIVWQNGQIAVMQ